MFTEFSERQLQEAYGRMDMHRHPWAKGTANEVDFIARHIAPGASILDLGCGQGRHVIELHKRGYTRAEWVDFSEPHLAAARQTACSRPNTCWQTNATLCAR